MNVYKWGVRVFRAWSEMPCNKARENEDHEPHAWDGQHTMYGPYMCWGHPERREPNEQDLRNEVGKRLEGMRGTRDLLEGVDPEVDAAFRVLERFAQGET